LNPTETTSWASFGDLWDPAKHQKFQGGFGVCAYLLWNVERDGADGLLGF